MPATTGAEMRTLMNAAKNPVSASMPMLPSERVALHGQRAAGGQRQEADDDDGAADHRQRACTHGDLGDQPDDLAAEVHRRVRHPGQRPQIEQHVVADAAQHVDRPA